MVEKEDELNIPWLVDHFAEITYTTTLVDPEIDKIEAQCRELFCRDYNVEILDNQGGELCRHYPRHIIVPTSYKECKPEEVVDEIKELVQKARLARCWSRFPAPVIFYKNKFICRSSTLATTAEILGRSGMEWLQGTSVDNSSEWETCDKLREADKELLKYIRVKHIFDMMVEHKKVKFGVSITSSEKADKEKRYCDFDLYCVPYPGTEFFTQFRTHQYDASSMHFDWDQAFINARLSLPDNSIVNDIPVNWAQYKQWNLIELTKSYLLLLIKCLEDGDGGLLLHCISGWDRTPLFTSLLRLTLWADGAIHHSLSAKEILYLTIAYDWMLFGHQLEDRLSKQEDVFLFCFYFLQFLKSDQFSVRQTTDLPDDKVKDEVFSDVRDETRYNSLESLSETVCSTGTAVPHPATGLAEDSNGHSHTKRSQSPSTLVLEDNKPPMRPRQSTGSCSSISSINNGAYDTFCNTGPVTKTNGHSNGATHRTNGVNGSHSNGGHSNGSHHGNGSLHSGGAVPIHQCEGNEGDNYQNYRGSNSSIDSWLMVSGSCSLKDGHTVNLDKIMESRRITRIESVSLYFGEAYRSLVAKGTITPTCNTSWSGMIGQIAESVSKVTFGSPPTSEADHPNNYFEMVALNSFNGNQSVTDQVAE